MYSVYSTTKRKACQSRIDNPRLLGYNGFFQKKGRVSMTTRNTIQYNVEYAVMNGLNWMLFCVTFTFAGVFLLAKGYSSTELGLILALGNILALPIQTVLADIADRSRRVTLLGLIAGMMLCLLLLAGMNFLLPGKSLVQSVVYTLALAGMQAVQPLMNSFCFYLSAWSGTDIRFGPCRAMGSLSYAVMSMVLAMAVDRLGVKAVPGAAAMLTGLLLLLLLVFFFQRKRMGAVAPVSREASPVESVGLFAFLRKYPRYGVFLAGVALIFVGHSFINNFTLQLVENVGGDTEEMGRLGAVMALMELPGMLGMAFLLRKARCSTVVKASLALFTVKVGLTWLAGSVPTLYAATLFQLVTYGLFIPASVQYAAEVIAPQEAVKGQAFITSMLTLGTVISSLIGGRLTDMFGVSAALLVFTVMSLAGSVLGILGTQKTEITQ